MAEYGHHQRGRSSRDEGQRHVQKEDVEMHDVPPPPPPRRRNPHPPKLEYRSGPNAGRANYDVQEYEERVIRVASSHSSRATTTSSSQRTEPRRRSARHDLKRSQSLPRSSRFDRDSEGSESDSAEPYERVVQQPLEAVSRSAKDGRPMKASYQQLCETIRWWQDCDVQWKQDYDRHVQAETDWANHKLELESIIQNFQTAQEQWSLEKTQWEGERAQLMVERENSIAEQQQQGGREQWLEAQLKDKTTRWKQTAKELNSLRAQGQGFYQVTDNYLEGLVTRLRYNIRSFAIQYFSGKLSKIPDFEKNSVWQQCMDVVIEKAKGQLDFTSDKRILMVQAFFWRILVNRIFYKYKWAGTNAGSMRQIHDALNVRPTSNQPSPAEIETIKKANIWRATTVGLLLDSQNRSQTGPNQFAERWKDDLFKDIDVNLRRIQPVYHEDYKQSFFEIMEEALVLDKEICRQVSGVEWILAERVGSRGWPFDPVTMELEGGGVPAKSDQALVIAPGVRKQGKSSGEGFEILAWLLKMEVICVTTEK